MAVPVDMHDSANVMVVISRFTGTHLQFHVVIFAGLLNCKDSWDQRGLPFLHVSNPCVARGATILNPVFQAIAPANACHANSRRISTSVGGEFHFKIVVPLKNNHIQPCARGVSFHGSSTSNS